MSLYSVIGDKLQLSLHPGQVEAWDNDRRFVFVIAGTQGGKTSFGPWWIDREIKRRGDGDYIAVSATYDLFKLKMLPEIKTVFKLVRPDWTYSKSERVYESPDNKTRLILRSADSEGGLESATAKGAWLDECGQPGFSLTAWEAVQRRISLSEGRVLGTTTPYNLGWLKTQIYDRWAAHDPDYGVVRFRSIDNPAFPRAEYERAKRTLPAWKFNMFYDAIFTRPAGMIYDCYDSAIHKIPAFTITQEYQSAGGMDFGGVHTAALRVVYPPDMSRFFVVDEYMQGGRTAAEHWAALKSWGAYFWVGGSWSEGQWRLEFQAAGMPIQEPPVKDVETGIQRVYSALKEGRLYITENCVHLLDEIERYSRVTDESGQPAIGVQNKQDYHYLDALRYIMAKLNDKVSWYMS